MENQLNILWTNASPLTSEKMLCMYAHNALLKGWWDAVTVIIWGETTQYVATDQTIQNRLREMMKDGVKFSACKACADQLGVTSELENLGVEVKYWGEPLTRILKGNQKLLTV